MPAFSTLATIAVLGMTAASTVKSVTQKVPKPPAPTPLPTAPDPLKTQATGVNAAMTKQRQRSTAGGRSSTILTGASGTTDTASAQRKTLIGY